MRITNQLLKANCKPTGHLHSAVYVDLSNCGIDRVEKLSFCKKLRTFNLSGNKIEAVGSVDSCPELWKLDLNNNKVRSLEGLSKFVALGTLVLCNNDLSWYELHRIQHMHILDLSLHGNPQLEQDPYYRIHVIDCLPNVWMLDGRLITSAERQKVKNFFQESSITDHPVRPKLRKDTFTPSANKNIRVNGIYGEKTTQLLTTFPVNTTLNIETDKKRLLFMALNMEDDLVTEGFTKRRASYVHKLLLSRDKEPEQCNMLLLLLVASLDFSMPAPLMEATLDVAQLSSFGEVPTMSLFLLPKDIRCSLVCLLLGSVKIERDNNVTGGLYDQLYLCLYNTVSELTRQSRCPPKTPFNMNKKTMSLLKDNRALIAAEVVQLLCIVPKFFEYIFNDAGVQQLINCATGNNPEIMDKVNMLMFAENHGMVTNHIHQDVAQLIVQGIEQTTVKLLKSSKMSKYRREIMKIKDSPVKYFRPTLSARSDRSKSSMRSSKYATDLSIDNTKRDAIRLGDKVLLGPQNMAKVISMPDPKIVLVQMDAVPAPSGAMIRQTQKPEEHYAYIDTAKVEWDQQGGYWRPKGTVGDRISIRLVDDVPGHLSSKSSSPGSAGTAPAPKTSLESIAAAPVIPCTINLFDDEGHGSPFKQIPRGVSEKYKDRISGPAADQPEKPEDSKSQQGSGLMEVVVEKTGRPVSSHTWAPSEPSTSDGKVLSRHASLESEDDAELQQFALQELVRHEYNVGTGHTDAQNEEQAILDAIYRAIKIPQVSEANESSSVLQTPRASSLSKESFTHPATPRELITPVSGTVPSVTFQDVRLTTRDLSQMTLNPDVAKEHRSRVIQSVLMKEDRPKSPPGKLHFAHPVTNQGGSSTTPGKLASSRNGKLSLRVQHGSKWLAEGRNLHLETMRSRPSSSREPGWKDGLQSRPASAASVKSRPKSSASYRSTGRPSLAMPSYNVYHTNQYIMGSGGIPTYGNLREERRPASNKQPRSKAISIDDYSLIHPKRVKFHNKQAEAVIPVGGVFTPSPTIYQPMAAKNRRKQSHKHKSGILCAECTYHQYPSRVVNLQFDTYQDDVNDSEEGYDGCDNSDAQTDLEGDLENQDIISTYQPYNVLMLDEQQCADGLENGHEAEANVDLHGTTQTQGQKVTVSGITIRVLHPDMMDSNIAEMQEGSAE